MKPPINPEPVNPDWTVQEREQHFRDQEAADLRRAIESKAAEKGCQPPTGKLIVSVIR